MIDNKEKILSRDYFVGALLKGDDRIISEIYQRFFPKILQFVLLNKGTHDAAEDIFQESLLHIVVRVQKKSINIESFEAYLFTVGKNMWRRELENQKKRVIKEEVYTLIDKDTNFAQFLIEHEQMELYREKFALLSDNCREILALFFNKVSYENIVEELSYATINTARQRIFKCKNKLVKFIKTDKRFKL
ncbi:sigma-70 family RNA polymerase sigma factor [uncultured Aquimarina sp.]|uniref:RNA polymerase sigma factor n=1 Tax=uncultured Aquimarina sp. TaxID=575652 RepID=UPI00261D660C|nr:sigma-70 family RNA polymerase sigma factor [uncultured Aquimarina sp.]